MVGPTFVNIQMTLDHRRRVFEPTFHEGIDAAIGAKYTHLVEIFIYRTLIGKAIYHIATFEVGIQYTLEDIYK